MLDKDRIGQLADKLSELARQLFLNSDPEAELFQRAAKALGQWVDGGLEGWPPISLADLSLETRFPAVAQEFADVIAALGVTPAETERPAEAPAEAIPQAVAGVSPPTPGPAEEPAQELQEEERALRAQELLELAQQHIQAGRWRLAVNALETAEKEYLADAAFREKLAQARRGLAACVAEALAEGKQALEAEQFDVAEKALRRVLELDSENQEALQGLKAITERGGDSYTQNKIRQVKHLLGLPDLASIEQGLSLARELESLGCLQDQDLKRIVEEAKTRRERLLAESGQMETWKAGGHYAETIKILQKMLDEGKTEFIRDSDKMRVRTADELERNRQLFREFARRKAGAYQSRAEGHLGHGQPRAARSVLDYLRAIPGLFEVLPDEEKTQVQELETKIVLEMERWEQANREVMAGQALLAQDAEQALVRFNLARALYPKYENIEGLIALAQNEIIRQRAGKAENLFAEAQVLFSTGKIDEAQDRGLKAQQLWRSVEQETGEALTAQLAGVQHLLQDIQALQDLQALVEQEWFAKAQEQIDQLRSELRDHVLVRRCRDEIVRHQDEARRWQEAQEAFDEGHFVEAARWAEELGSRVPGAKRLAERAYAALAFRQGMAAWKSGDLQTAAEKFQRVVALNGDQKQDAEQYRRQIDPDSPENREAKDALEQARALRKTNLLAAWNLLQGYRDRPSVVKRDIQQEADSIYDELRSRLRQEINRLGAEIAKCLKPSPKRYDRALSLYEESLAHLRVLRQELQSAERADVDLEREVNLGYCQTRAEAHTAMGRLGEALEAWREARKWAPFDVEIARRARETCKDYGLQRASQALYAIHSPSEAIRVLEKETIPEEPELGQDRDILLLLTRAHLRARQFSEAEAYCRQMLRLFPQDNEVKQLVGYARQLRAMTESLERARELVQEANWEILMDVLEDLSRGLQDLPSKEARDFRFEIEGVAREAMVALRREAAEARDLSDQTEGLIRAIRAYATLLRLNKILEEGEDPQAKAYLRQKRTDIITLIDETVRSAADLASSADEELDTILDKAQKLQYRLRHLSDITAYVRIPEAQKEQLEQARQQVELQQRLGSALKAAVCDGKFRVVNEVLRELRQKYPDLARTWQERIQQAEKPRQEIDDAGKTLKRAFADDDFEGIIAACDRIKAQCEALYRLGYRDFEVPGECVQVRDTFETRDITDLVEHRRLAERRKENLSQLQRWSEGLEKDWGEIQQTVVQLEEKREPVDSLRKGWRGVKDLLQRLKSQIDQPPVALLSHKAQEVCEKLGGRRTEIDRLLSRAEKEERHWGEIDNKIRQQYRVIIEQIQRASRLDQLDEPDRSIEQLEEEALADERVKRLRGIWASKRSDLERRKGKRR